MHEALTNYLKILMSRAFTCEKNYNPNHIPLQKYSDYNFKCSSYENVLYIHMITIQ